jgi:hypothetical protein
LIITALNATENFLNVFREEWISHPLKPGKKSWQLTNSALIKKE